jgi:hypothetical protein
MDRREQLLYHQIHPLKLVTDVGTAVVAAALLWAHRFFIAILVGLVPSILVTIALLRWANLDPYRRSRLGRYISRFMTRRVEAARLAALVPLWGGAWLHSVTLMIFGVAWIVACWLWGLRRRP